MDIFLDSLWLWETKLLKVVENRHQWIWVIESTFNLNLTLVNGLLSACVTCSCIAVSHTACSDKVWQLGMRKSYWSRVMHIQLFNLRHSTSIISMLNLHKTLFCCAVRERRRPHSLLLLITQHNSVNFYKAC